MNKKIIYNSSMPRSGSELLQVIMHQNPKIYGSTTSPVLEYLYVIRNNTQLPEAKSQDQELMKKAFLSICKSLPQDYYKELTDRPIVFDKNRAWSFYYEWISQFNNDVKIVCMVRNLNSIVSSMEKIFRKNLDKPIGPINPQNIQNMTLQERVGYWLESHPIGISLKEILDLFNRGISEKVLFIKYEDFCEDPQVELKKIYEYINEEEFEHYFSGIKKEVFENDEYFGIYGDHKVKPEIQKPNLKEAENILGKNICRQIEKDYGWYFNTFNY